MLVISWGVLLPLGCFGATYLKAHERKIYLCSWRDECSPCCHSCSYRDLYSGTRVTFLCGPTMQPRENGRSKGTRWAEKHSPMSPALLLVAWGMLVWGLSSRCGTPAGAGVSAMFPVCPQALSAVRSEHLPVHTGHLPPGTVEPQLKITALICEN